MYLISSMKIIKTDTLEKQNNFHQNSCFSRSHPPSACKYESQQLTLTKNMKKKKKKNTAEFSIFIFQKKTQPLEEAV